MSTHVAPAHHDLWAGVSEGEPAGFAIVGTGYRTEYFLRIAAALPDRLQVTALFGRNESRALELGDRFGVPIVSDFEALVRTRPGFVLVCVAWGPTPGFIKQAVAAGLPVLTETPPAPDAAGLRDLWADVGGGDAPVQVAEQYQFQPMHAARIAIARSGLLGIPQAAHSWHCHGYHGVSLIRLLLGTGGVEATVQGFASPERLLSRPGRADESAPLEESTTNRILARFDFGAAGADTSGGYGIFEFDGTQYWSPIRSRGVAVRGTRGELVTDDVRWFGPDDTPLSAPLVRHAGGVDGDMTAHALWRISLGGDVVYTNPVAPARLHDDEIAGAETLGRMVTFANTGRPFYPLADGCQDHYLSLLMDEAVLSAAPVQAEAQPWADDLLVGADRS
jgi:predicted dehydrogenase